MAIFIARRSKSIGTPDSGGTVTESAPAASDYLFGSFGGELQFVQLSTLGETISQGAIGSAIQDGHQLWVNQGGYSDVVVTFAGVWNYITGKLPTYKPSTVTVAASRPLDPSTDHAQTLEVTASGVTLSLANGSANPADNNLGDGFWCNVVNTSGATVALDPLMTSNSGLHTLNPNAVCKVYGLSSVTFVEIFGAGGSSQLVEFGAYSPSPAAVTEGNSNVAVTIDGTLTGYSAAPTLQYSLDGSDYAALPGGSTTTASTFSFTLTLTGGSHSLVVQDAAPNGPSASLSLPVEGASLANIPASGTEGQPVSGATVTLLGLNSAYAVLALSGGADEGSRVQFSGTSVPALTPQNSGNYVWRVYDAATGGNKLAEAGTTTVTVGSVLAISSYPSSTTTSTNVAVSGTYADGTPSGFTYAWSGSGGSGAASGPTISGGAWSASVPAPTAPGSYTLTITGTGGNTLSASTGTISVASATISVNTPTGTIYPSSALTLAGGFTGNAPASVDYQYDGTGGSWTTVSCTEDGSAWSAAAMSPSGVGTHTVYVRETADTSIASAASDSFAVSAAPAFGLSSYTVSSGISGATLLPQALGVAGQSLSFSGQYTGSAPSPSTITATATPLGGSAAAVTLSNVTFSGGTVTFSLACPATGGSYALNLSWSGGSAGTTFFVQSAASNTYDLEYASSDVVWGNGTRPYNPNNTWGDVYLMTAGNGTVSQAPGSPASGYVGAGASMWGGYSLSKFAPPPGASDNGPTPHSPNLMNTANYNSTGHFYATQSIDIWTADAPGAYYYWSWFTNGADTFAFVSSNPVTTAS